MLLNEAELKAWLAEDIETGDITTKALIDPQQEVLAFIIAKEDGVCFGIDLCEEVLDELKAIPQVLYKYKDGQTFKKGQKLLELQVNYSSILQAERLTLNLMQRLCGVSTTAKRYQDAVSHTRAKILDTRKTTPGLRRLEKAAVVAGGAHNHRIGLYDQFLIKENHLSAFRHKDNPFAEAIAKAKQVSAEKPIIIEVENLKEVELCLDAQPNVILLDNMSLEDMTQAVKITDQKSPNTECEASGGITWEHLVPVAETGVHRISVGALTHSAPNLDLSMLIDQI